MNAAERLENPVYITIAIDANVAKDFMDDLAASQMLSTRDNEEGVTVWVPVFHEVKGEKSFCRDEQPDPNCNCLACISYFKGKK